MLFIRMWMATSEWSQSTESWCSHIWWDVWMHISQLFLDIYILCKVTGISRILDKIDTLCTVLLIVYPRTMGTWLTISYWDWFTFDRHRAKTKLVHFLRHSVCAMQVIFYFDVVTRLYKELTLIVDEPEKDYPTTGIIWSRFVSVFCRTYSLILYAPVFRAYFYQTLQEFYDDGVQYIELRTLLPPVSTILAHICYVFYLYN